MSAADSSVAGASGSSKSAPVFNVLSVFAAHFHVRRGNEVIWAAGLHTVEQLSKQGVEWKVLPSGSHLLEDDIIFFDVAQQQAADKHGHLVGVAAFKNRRLRDDDRTGAGGNVDDDDDQRGARMMAVGAIVDCGSQRTPWTQLAATLPHTCQLEKLVNALSGDPSCRNILQQWLDTHQRKAPFLQSRNRQINLEGFFYPHDPLLMLPAVSNALGPYLPCLIKSLITTPFRLLLFVPPGSKSLQAASIAFNLAELVYTACQSPSKSSHDRCPVLSKRTTEMQPLHGLDVKGLVGLHDVDRLKMHDEDKDARGWIAYTSDRILLEKLDLFDGLLDLSPMMHSHDTDLVDATALPRYRCTVRLAAGQNGKREVVARKQNWTTREFAVFRGLDERAALDASSARQVRKALSRKRASSESQITVGSANDVNEPASSAVRRSPVRHPSTSTFIAFLTFWLSSLRFLPQRWRINLRESYGYVPLSIRSDGGIRASIMLLPTSDEEDDDLTDDEEAGNDSHFSSHLGVPGSVGQQAVRQRSYSNALSVEGEEQQDSDIVNDPILAAVGAGSFAHRRRNSRTVSSSHRSAAQLASEVASIHGGDGRSISPELSIQRDRNSIVRADEEWREAERDARESVRLALCLFAAWSSWVEDLVLSVQDIVQDNLASDDPGIVDEVGQVNGATDAQTVNSADDSRPLVKRQQDDAYTVLITSSAMSQIGLSNTNSIDVALVRFLASTVTDCAIEIERGWSILSWLCW